MLGDFSNLNTTGINPESKFVETQNRWMFFFFCVCVLQIYSFGYVPRIHVYLSIYLYSKFICMQAYVTFVTRYMKLSSIYSTYVPFLDTPLFFLNGTVRNSQQRERESPMPFQLTIRKRTKMDCGRSPSRATLTPSLWGRPQWAWIYPLSTPNMYMEYQSMRTLSR